jgi:adenylate cyclase, class 2
MNNIRNFEIKSRHFNAEVMHKQLMSLDAEYVGEDHQVDTYFIVKKGRLKLREGNIENTLIYYNRENTAKSRMSEIMLEKLQANNNLKQLLTQSNGILKVVDKKRRIYFIDNVKFHIDRVKGLGNFVEIEAIDTADAITDEQLKRQCQTYIDKFELKQKDFQSLSYSDLVGESFGERISREASSFLESLRENLPATLSLDEASADHMCYRASSEAEYIELKENFKENGTTLIESKIGGRNIITFKLDKEILNGNFKIDIIELAAPKMNNKYAIGFEHVEVVISESFDEFIQAHDGLVFDCSAITKKHNPELRYKLESGQSVKFHHNTLAEVIRLEKSSS